MKSTISSSLWPDASICFPVSFLIYLTLSQQAQCSEVQFDISPTNLQRAMKQEKWFGMNLIPDSIPKTP